MASYQPPSEFLPIFDNAVFTATNGSSTSTGGGLTLAQANLLYLRKTFPDACSALETFNAGIETTFLNASGNITASGDVTGTYIYGIPKTTSIQSTANTNVLNLATDQTTGVLNIGTSSSRSGNINIGTNATSGQLSLGSSTNTQTNLYGSLLYLANNTEINGNLTITTGSIIGYLTSALAASTYATIASLSSYLTIATAAATYLTQVSASTTYATIASLSSYLTTATAAATYLSQVSASTTYLTISNASSTYATIASLSSYLTTAAAASTYATIASLSSYLTTAAAASTYATIASLGSYLTTASASSTYAPLTNPTFNTGITLSSGNINASTGGIAGTSLSASGGGPIQTTGIINGGTITGTSLNTSSNGNLTLGTGNITSVKDITASGNISGTFSGSISGGSVSCTTLGASGAITGASYSGGTVNGTTFTCTSLNTSNGAIALGTGSISSVYNITASNIISSLTFEGTYKGTSYDGYAGSTSVDMFSNQTSGSLTIANNGLRTGLIQIARGLTGTIEFGASSSTTQLYGNTITMNGNTTFNNNITCTGSITGTTNMTIQSNPSYTLYLNPSVSGAIVCGSLGGGGTNYMYCGDFNLTGNLNMTNKTVTCGNISSNGTLLTGAATISSLNCSGTASCGATTVTSLNSGSGTITTTGNIFGNNMQATGYITLTDPTNGNLTAAGTVRGDKLTSDSSINLGSYIICPVTPPSFLNTTLNYYYNYPAVSTTGIISTGYRFNPTTNTAGGVNYFKAGVYVVNLNSVTRYTGSPTAVSYTYNIGIASGTTTGTVTTGTVSNISPVSPSISETLLTGGNNNDSSSSHTLCFTLSIDSFVNLFINISAISITSGTVNITSLGTVRRIG
jgi:hypothetical protein